MFNGSFKQNKEYTYSKLTAALDFVQHVAASDLVVSVVPWTHSIITFQRYLSLRGAWEKWFSLPALNVRLRKSVMVIQNTYGSNSKNSYPKGLRQ